MRLPSTRNNKTVKSKSHVSSERCMTECFYDHREGRSFGESACYEIYSMQAFWLSLKLLHASKSCHQMSIWCPWGEMTLWINICFCSEIWWFSLHWRPSISDCFYLAKEKCVSRQNHWNFGTLIPLCLLISVCDNRYRRRQNHWDHNMKQGQWITLWHRNVL